MEKINVTELEPRLKHPTIFNRYDSLEAGESFVIHNDHDPKPLYYQLVAERGQTFEWEYLLNGPEIWEVKLTKLHADQKPTTVGEMAANDYRKAEVFRKYGIDFCCGGKKTLEQACQKKGLDVLKVRTELESVDARETGRTEDYQNWDLDFLADYIINKHHKYVKDSHPLLYEFSAKVSRVHGSRHPELLEIERYFNAVADELTSHMQKEEMILFPYIKELARAKKENTQMQASQFGSIQNPINMMEDEHVSAGGNMDMVKELSNNFTPPDDACNSYRVLFAKLKEYEEDLHHHIHLENNILFVKAIALEKELLGLS